MFDFCPGFALVEADRGISRYFPGVFGVAFLLGATLAVGGLRLVLFYIRITDKGKSTVDTGTIDPEELGPPCFPGV